jgi:hypothetical protein
MNYSLLEILNEYNENKVVIDAYLKGQSVENYDNVNDGSSMFGLGIGLFVSVLLISIGLWIWALWAVIHYWDKLPDWARIIGILGLLPIIPGGVIASLISVYVGKHK